MSPLQKNRNIKQANQVDTLLLPVTGMVFSKKLTSKEKPEKNSIDFHLEIMNKIDKLLKEHESETFSSDSTAEQQINNSPEEPPVEIRVPLSKRIGLSEVEPDTKPDDIFTNRETIPEEFKTDLSVTNTPDFKEDVPQMKETENEHIEIVDIDSLSVGEVTSQKKSILLLDEDRGVKHQTSNISKNISDSDNISSKKVEVIDTKELSNKKCNKVFSKMMQQPNENEKKAQVYYLNSGSRQKENKLKEPESERLYIPTNFGDKLRQREVKEGEKELKQKKKELKKKEKEAEKLKKLEAKKAMLEAREKEKTARKAEKEKEVELKRQEKGIEEEKLEKLEVKKAIIAAKEKEPVKQETVSPAKSISETEELTEWTSYDTEEEIPTGEPVSEESVKEQIVELPEEPKEEKPFDEDQEKISKEREIEARLAEREKQAELRRQEREQRVKEKEEQQLKRIEAKKTLIEARERKRAARIAEREKRAELKRQEKEQRLKEKEDTKQEFVSPTKSISEAEELTEGTSDDAEEETPTGESVNEESIKEQIVELSEEPKEEKPFDEDQEKISKEKEIEARLAERERQAELRRQEREQRAKEKEAKKLKKIATTSKKHLSFFKKEKKKGYKKKLSWGKKKEGHEKTDEKPEQTLLDEDVKKLLVITDNLLGDLPEEVIDKFAQSEDFKLYSKVLSRYKIK